MAFILSLNQISRYPVAAVGPFAWSHEHQRHVFKGALLTDARSLAAAVNEALPILQQLDNPFLEMKVVEVPDAAPEPVADRPLYDAAPDKAKRLKVAQKPAEAVLV